MYWDSCHLMEFWMVRIESPQEIINRQGNGGPEAQCPAQGHRASCQQNQDYVSLLPMSCPGPSPQLLCFAQENGIRWCPKRRLCGFQGPKSSVTVGPRGEPSKDGKWVAPISHCWVLNVLGERARGEGVLLQRLEKCSERSCCPESLTHSLPLPGLCRDANRQTRKADEVQAHRQRLPPQRTHDTQLGVASSPRVPQTRVG